MCHFCRWFSCCPEVPISSISILLLDICCKVWLLPWLLGLAMYRFTIILGQDLGSRVGDGRWISANTSPWCTSAGLVSIPISVLMSRPKIILNWHDILTYIILCFSGVLGCLLSLVYPSVVNLDVMDVNITGIAKVAVALVSVLSFGVPLVPRDYLFW